jgi:putative membrane protein insertion efficiency factor
MLSNRISERSCSAFDAMRGIYAPDTSTRAWLARRLALGVIRGYQILISPLFAGSCRFLPSCSAYAAEAVDRHGALKGGFLALRRLARCHPLCAGGYDPVP